MREITERELNLIADEIEGNANMVNICYNKENDEYYCFTSAGSCQGPNIIFSVNWNYYMDSDREEIKEDIKNKIEVFLL
jgi:hypothetical protein